ncbi:Probable pectinesterase/pectinesterase inhibitor 16 [Linum grandiflorum]
MSFKNTTGPEGYQAVALRVQADKSAFIECAINAYQESRTVGSQRSLVPLVSYLGRPWKAYSRVVVMEEIGGAIHPQGWMPWEGDLYLDTLFFVEYGNHGTGVGTDRRVDGRDQREGGLVSDIGEEMRG